jgi:hypothetical protein
MSAIPVRRFEDLNSDWEIGIERLMSRKPRNFRAGYTYHVTTRCNNREFKLQRLECREVFLYAIKQALDKYKFKLYGSLHHVESYPLLD